MAIYCDSNEATCFPVLQHKYQYKYKLPLNLPAVLVVLAYYTYLY